MGVGRGDAAVTGRYLLDSHVFLDMAADALNPSLTETLATADAVYLSAASVAELCIKSAIGKLVLPTAIEADPESGFAQACFEGGLTPLPIDMDHAARLRTLPMHHRDPFDRLLIAQALVEGVVLVSRDAAFSDYDGLALLRA